MAPYSSRIFGLLLLLLPPLLLLAGGAVAGGGGGGAGAAAFGFQFPKIKFVGIGPTTKEEEHDDANAPHVLVRNGPDAVQNLKRRVERHCGIIAYNNNNRNTAPNDGAKALFRWEPKLRESYEVADAIFREIASLSASSSGGRWGRISVSPLAPPVGEKNGGSSDDASVAVVLSFPSMSRPEDLVNLASVLTSDACRRLIGVEDASAVLYPSSPAPYLRIVLIAQEEQDSTEEGDKRMDNGAAAASSSSGNNNVNDIVAASSSATKDWVNDFLGRYALCPYTSSTSRAAVGLSSVGVPAGGVHVQVVVTTTTGGTTTTPDDSKTGGREERRRSHNYDDVRRRRRATKLVSSFWSEVVALMRSPQEERATSLLVFPEYDSQFESFVEICDDVVEPTVVATRATDVVGRAWFHPLYDADAVGHSDVVAGHAVPHEMVEGFATKSLLGSSPSSGRNSGRSLPPPLSGYDELAEANNTVRRTPHATINILRRSQLVAAGEYERGLGDKQRPKANSIYVRNAMRLSEVIKKKSNRK